MRDYRKFFRQLCLAMGIVTAGPAAISCSADSEVGAKIDVSSTDSSTADGQTEADSGQTTEDVTTDVTIADDVPGAVDTGTPDVPGAEDVPGPQDTHPLGDDGNPVEDTFVAVDMAEPDVPSAHDTSGSDVAVDIATADDAMTVEPEQCENGPGVVTCYTAEQLQYNIDNPPFGGAPGKADTGSYEGPLPPEGCPKPEIVLDGCCNPATGTPTLVGATCCYTHCQSGCCGRPLVVEGHARVAELSSASTWAKAGTAPETVTPAARQLAAAFRDDARDEHASVASFMRFGLELMHVGAPPEMVADAASAARDEVRHAQLATDIARRLDGRSEAPGALKCDDVLPRGDHAEIVRACILEGCLGETLAAAQVAAAARATDNAETAAILSEIAEDEGRHAELAWRFVAWTWRLGDTDLRTTIRETFDAVRRRPVIGDAREALLVGVSDAERRQAGRLGRDHAEATNRQTLLQVVLPCADALMAEA